MIKTFNELNTYYNLYLSFSLVQKKIYLLAKIKSLENKLLNAHQNNLLKLDNLIINNLYLNCSFKTYRHLYLLSLINISERNSIKLTTLFQNFIHENLYKKLYLNHIHYILIIMKNFPRNNGFETYIYSIKNKPIFELYKCDFIFILSYHATSESILFLLKLIKINHKYKEEIFWTIGKIISLNSSIPKIILEKYINYLIKYLSKKNLIFHSDNLFFSLAIIFLKFSNKIDGYKSNKLSDLLFLHKEPFIMKKIALKSLNNSPLNELELNIFFKKLNSFNYFL